MNYEVDYGAPKVPADKIVDLTLAKMNSNIDADYADEDDLFNLNLDAAADAIESYLGFPILERDNLTIIIDWFDSFALPVKVNSITSIKYIDTNSVEQTLQPADYSLLNGVLTLGIDKPGTYKKYLTITCTAGYAKANIPAYAKRAALLAFAESETYRENRPVKIDTSMKSVLRPHRLY